MTTNLITDSEQSRHSSAEKTIIPQASNPRHAGNLKSVDVAVINEMQSLDYGTGRQQTKR